MITDPESFLIMLVVVIVFVAIGCFGIGFAVGENRKKADDAYNPKLRPDEHFKTR